MRTIRDRAIDAGIELVGTEGLRALSHARVDERAGLPKGSTSNYFRTRQSLLLGVMDGLGEREGPAVSAAFAPTSAVDLVDSLSALLDWLSSDSRTATTARLVLFMEASHNEPLRESLSWARAAMEQMLVVALTGLGARSPDTAAFAVAACFEGLLLHRIARHDRTDPRPTFDLVVGAALA